MGLLGRPRLYHPDRPATSAERQRVFAQKRRVTWHTLVAKTQRQAYFLSQKEEWGTPPAFFQGLDAEFGFTLDVCAHPATAKCARFFTRADDGLRQDWGQEICWMNPPYGRLLPQWMEKAVTSWQAGATVVALVPARTCTQWWHQSATQGEIRFLQGRLRFDELHERDGLWVAVPAKETAPFPSAVVIYRP